jgi:TolA-binding protein
LRGIYDGSDDVTGARNERQQSSIAQRGAKYYYLLAMPSQADLRLIAPLVRQAAEQRGQGRPFDEAIKLVVERKEAWTQDLVSLYRFDWASSEQRKRDDAVYWMGVLCAQQGDDKTAMQYLGPMLLDDTLDDPWTSGAQFNLAQCYERLGKTEEAIKLYQADRSPQRYGNRLRAERLKQEAAKKK